MVSGHLSCASAFTCFQIPSGVLVLHLAVQRRRSATVTCSCPAPPGICYFHSRGAAGRGPVLRSVRYRQLVGKCLRPAWSVTPGCRIPSLSTDCITYTYTRAAGNLPPATFWFKQVTFSSRLHSHSLGSAVSLCITEPEKSWQVFAQMVLFIHQNSYF